MANTDIRQVLSEAMDTYASLVLATGDKEVIIRKGTVIDSVRTEKAGLQFLRESFLNVGEILEEDEKNQTVIGVIPTGSMNAARALVASRCEGESVSIAAFFKEGLIKQHGAQRAIDKLKDQFKR